MELIETKELYENDAFVIIEAEFEGSVPCAVILVERALCTPDPHRNGAGKSRS